MATAFLTPDILTEKRRRLAQLEQRAARDGYTTPPEVANEIVDLRIELAAAAAPASDAERYVALADAIQDVRQRIDDVGRRVDRLHWLMPILMVLLCGFLVLLVKL
jgi:hypothetical protein